MTAGLETFAKVRALHDRATIPGEKAAAKTRMEALARKAGMTVDEAVSKLDAEEPTVVASKTFDSASAFSDAFHDFFNSPEMRAARAERDREREAKGAAGRVRQRGCRFRGHAAGGGPPPRLLAADDLGR